MATQTYDVTSTATFDSNLIEISGSVFKLKTIDNPSQNFNQNFSSGTGFTLDSAKSEITGGQAQQKDQRPANSILAATYASSLNANWGADGFVSTAANLNGTPTLSSGKASCVGTQGLYYQDTLIGNLDGNWAVKFKYTPNYTTGPASNVNIISFATPSSSTDEVVIFNSPSGNNLRITANGLTAQTFGAWSPTSGTEYTFEIFCISNVVTLYVDNVQIGTGKTISPGQGTGATQFWIGAYTGLYDTADGSFDDVIVYSSAAQTPSYTIPETKYVSDVITLPAFTYSGLETLQSFDAFTTTESNDPLYVLNNMYWNGSAWVMSDDTPAQANTASVINTNISSLLESDTLTVKIITSDGNDQMSVSDLTTEYTGRIYPTSNPTITFTETISMGDLEGVVETSTKTGSDEVQYVQFQGAVPRYWNGASWAISDETYAQANTAAVIETNKATFTSTAVTYKVTAYLHSADGSTTPELTSLVVTYDFQDPAPCDVDTCVVYGYTYSSSGAALNGKTVSAVLGQEVVEYCDDVVIYKTTVSTTTDSSGYWELQLVENVSMTAGANYDITFTTDTGNRVYSIVVPNEVSKAIGDLI